MSKNTGTCYGFTVTPDYRKLKVTSSVFDELREDIKRRDELLKDAPIY